MDADEAVRLRRAVGKLARSFNSSATDEDLTPTQASVLGLVVARGPMPSAELARVENLNPTMVSRVVGALAGRGLVERAPDPADLRSVLVGPTSAGRAVSRRVKEQRALAIRATSAGLTEEQHEALLAALPALEALARLAAPGPALGPARSRDGAS